VRRPARLALLGLLALAAAAVVVARPGCSTTETLPTPKPGELIEVARSDGILWTGVAVSDTSRLFAAHPRLFVPPVYSLVEILPGGRRRPFPDEAANSWHAGAPFPAPQEAWVCVQSLRCDAQSLWVLDTGNPGFVGVMPGGAKLWRVDLSTRKPLERHPFPPEVAHRASFLRDVRIDENHRTAFVSDSGDPALIVVDLDSGAARRVLEGYASTRAEPGVVLTVEGETLDKVLVHVAPLALDRKREWLYWQALCGRTLWRAPTAVLRDATLPPERVAAAVERVGDSPAASGLEMDDDDTLYLAAVEKDAILMRRRDGTTKPLVTDPRLSWPDTLAVGPNRTLYVSTSQLHRTPLARPGSPPIVTPYRILATGLPRLSNP